MSATETVTAEAVSWVKCYCCELTEECTPRYIDGVRERYEGRWICGLCAEAVKEEAAKSPKGVAMSTDEALERQVSFVQKFRSSSSSPPDKPAEDLILAIKQILFRSIDSPRGKKNDPMNFRSLGRSQSCFSTIPGTERRRHTGN